MSASPKQKNDNVARARDAWGTPPDWVLVLAEACNMESQAAVGRQLKYAGSTISQVLSNTYMGDMERFEQVVRGVLMAETVICPRLGETSRNVCQQWQRRPFSTASSNAVAMYQACRSGCPHSRLQGGGDDA
tara:strand:- start:16439 stop:16834 length:396 start_codon:yes stop_codon:yes gene_type:complete